MNIFSYLSRIGLTKLDLEDDKFKLLCKIQEQHLYTVPYENTEYLLGIRDFMTPKKIYEKIVLEKRGGICLEINYLLYLLLKELGFTCTLISGKVRRNFLDHMIILVHLDQDYLVDVGFGEFSFRHPLPFNGVSSSFFSGTFRIINSEEGVNSYCLQRKEENEWTTKYVFTKEKREPQDFRESWDWFRTSSNPISENRICTIETPYGTVNLLNDTLSIIYYNEKFTFDIKDLKSNPLLDFFGISTE